MSYLDAMSLFRRIAPILIAVGLGLAGLPAGADIALQDLELALPGLDDSLRRELLETGELSHPLNVGDALVLAPTGDLRTEIESGFAAIDFTVGMEVLFLIAEPYERHGMNELTSKLLEMSTLAGVEYYSESRGKVRTLFVDSYTIDNAEDRNRIPDTTIAGLPSSGTVHVYQRDTTFGWNPNTITYEVDGSSIHMVTTNDSSFKWGFIPIIRAGALNSHLVVVRSENFMIYYANFGSHAMQVSFFESRIHDSYYNRLVALKEWFEAKLEQP